MNTLIKRSGKYTIVVTRAADREEVAKFKEKLDAAKPGDVIEIPDHIQVNQEGGSDESNDKET